jgi:Xylose isomerase-like TIM barrel
MPKIAFSTVACPDWTLEQVAQAAARHEFDGVELRTFGTGSTSFACDPALTASAKTRRLFGEGGIKVASLATSVRFDTVIRPRVIGRVCSDIERDVREANRAIGLAAQIECPFVRVSGFEVPRNEKKTTTMNLIVERLKAVADHAHRSGVRVALENGGSFCSAADVGEIVGRVNSPLVGVSWCMKSGQSVGEGPLPESIAGSTFLLRLRDVGAAGGIGDCESNCACQEAVGTLASDGPPDAWVVYEWCRAWVGGDDKPQASVDEVLATAGDRLFAWVQGRGVEAGSA